MAALLPLDAGLYPERWALPLRLGQMREANKAAADAAAASVQQVQQEEQEEQPL